MKNNASLVYNLVLMLSDIGALLIATALAFAIRANSSIAVAHPMPVSDYLVIMIAILPFWILIFALLGLY